MGKFPKCYDCKCNCFAYIEGECFALANTNFIEDGFRYPCPFYRDSQEVDQERRNLDDPEIYKMMRRENIYLKLKGGDGDGK